VKKNVSLKIKFGIRGTLTKLFMHASSRNMFQTTRNLQIRVCMFAVLTIVVETN